MVGVLRSPQGSLSKFWAGWAVCTHCDLDGLMGKAGILAELEGESSHIPSIPLRCQQVCTLRNKNHAPESRPTLTNQTKNQMDRSPKSLIQS